MIRLLLASMMMLQETSASQCPTAEWVRLGTVATSTDYEGKLVEVCGAFHGRSGRHGDLDERLFLYGPDQWGYHTGITVHDPRLNLGEDGRKVCIVGTQRRRDGLSREEVRARGLGTTVTTDLPVRLPDYVFYPRACPQDAPARG